MNMKIRRNLTLLAIAALAWSAPSTAQICGCAGSPDSLGDFDSLDPATWPPGSTQDSATLTIPLPDDGVLIFDSALFGDLPGVAAPFARIFRFETSGTARRNVPVTLLVAGDVTLTQSATINLNGENGARGDSGVTRSTGGAPGPGGSRGGDGAYQIADPDLNEAGGFGFGAGGGSAGDPAAGGDGDGIGGVFVASADLLPLIGGSGGGGGNSRDTLVSCGGGGGGGGGGALLLAANGTVSLTGSIRANGGAGGSNGGQLCSSAGGGGSGGAIRILADTIEQVTTTANITATGGTASPAGQASFGSDGIVRLEAFTNNFPPNETDPIAFIVGAPGTLVSPINQRVGITSVAGETLSVRNNLPLDDSPQGAFGEVDVVLLAPGSIAINVATAGIPAGTSVEVVAKARRGGNLISAIAPLVAGNCDATGACQAATSLDLAAGQYVLEARATFQP